jgi:hypothetical protein
MARCEVTERREEGRRIADCYWIATRDGRGCVTWRITGSGNPSRFPYMTRSSSQQLMAVYPFRLCQPIFIFPNITQTHPRVAQCSQQRISR